MYTCISAILVFFLPLSRSRFPSCIIYLLHEGLLCNMFYSESLQMIYSFEFFMCKCVYFIFVFEKIFVDIRYPRLTVFFFQNCKGIVQLCSLQLFNEISAVIFIFIFNCVLPIPPSVLFF